MSLGDVKVISGGAGNVIQFRVDDRTTSSQTGTIKAGEPVQLDNSNFVEIIATGGPVQTDGLFAGIAHNESSETSSAEGVVEVEQVIPNYTVLRAKATTPANINTDAKLLAIEFDSITFTNSSNVITINEDEGDDPNVHGLLVVGGDIVKGTLDFVVKPLATVFGRSV
jgi:hypothetical protein